MMVNRADPNDIYSGSIGEVSRGGSTALLFAARNGDADSAKLLKCEYRDHWATPVG